MRHIDYKGILRSTGLKKRLGSVAKVKAFIIPVIPQSQWKPTKITNNNVPILDQGMRGSCVGHGSVTMLMKTRDSAGMSFDLLSPIFLYDQINGGVDNGSDPADAVNILQSLGTCLMSSVPENAPLNKNKLPKSAYTEALRFKLHLAYSLNTFEQLVTAFLLGFKCGFTINVGNTFDLDKDGIVTFTKGVANHWVAVGEELKQVVSPAHSPIWALQFDNSWSTSWGENGRAFITSEHIDGQPNLEMYAYKAVDDDPQDSNDIPIKNAQTETE